MTQRDQLLDQLQDFLEYKKEEGFKTVDISPETRAALNRALAAPKKASSQAVTATRPTAARPAATAGPAVSAARRPPAAPASGVRRPAPMAAVCKAQPEEEPVAASNTLRVRGKTLPQIADQISHCTACPLSGSRKQALAGEGNSNRPDILFIGDTPGPEEDSEGHFFAGETGQLLEKIIGAMGYKREEIFMTTLTKCHPPENRIPFPAEMITCTPYLKAQIALIRPKVIVTLGKTAVAGLLNKPVAITRLRGTWKTYNEIPLMPTFHMGYLIEVPAKKREVWADMKAVLARLGKQPPARK